jgi:hypothetical protein
MERAIYLRVTTAGDKPASEQKEENVWLKK